MCIPLSCFQLAVPQHLGHRIADGRHDAKAKHQRDAEKGFVLGHWPHAMRQDDSLQAKLLPLFTEELQKRNAAIMEQVTPILKVEKGTAVTLAILPVVNSLVFI